MKGPQMTHTFDKQYWEQHWNSAAGQPTPPNPYLAEQTGGLTPGSALDAGCGEGTEAIWLAAQGWQVTGADISAQALEEASKRAAGAAVADRVRWVEADLTTWEPGSRFDLVVTNYAHPAMPQLDFYRRAAGWVAEGGTLLIVGHLHGHTSDVRHPAPGHSHEHGAGQPPEHATVTLADTVAVLDADRWRIETAEERHRTLQMPDRELALSDLVVRAVRIG